MLLRLILLFYTLQERSDDRSYIEILTPSGGEVQSSGAATLVCLVFGVSEQARVYWVIEHGLTDSGSGDSSDSTPDFIRNQITIAGELVFQMQIAFLIRSGGMSSFSEFSLRCGFTLL
ncbi:hypothetical protein EOD39_20754 [Acipenser ruthenus]|uniref:Ig-like domain-containing protein n=1 Tax=Acipenser ruthenus TaxID=7906 RepID=A0A444UUK6_ACIRT|nr:hypothetical protein EOD39_20754 [Acipenser ruthenus]